MKSGFVATRAKLAAMEYSYVAMRDGAEAMSDLSEAMTGEVNATGE